MTAATPPEATARFEELVRRYAGLVRAVVVRVGGPAGAAQRDDIEQKVFTEIWKQVRGEQTIDSPSSYVYRAAVRETLRLLRREERAGAVEPRSGPAAAGIPTPFETLRSRELGRKIREVLAELQPEREVAVRAHLAGYSMHEIMRLRGWSYNRTRNLIARGMADLRRRLEERGIHD